ncbi:transposase [Streptomyces sp. VB1]|uniref:transposase n=1 Tax=Streptomyces sp. VB1 TaxID=2986803 RepID=UPI002241EDBB|nr:transposase [Streptomyces sp. VB1]
MTKTSPLAVQILFADQVGIRSDRVTGRTWGVKGRTPMVRRTGNRFSVNAMSAISTKGHMHFIVFTESFDATVLCRFLARIVEHFDRKVHSAHRSKTVRAWLADHKDKIELHLLPSHSPEMDPDELVNADLRRSLPQTRRARNRTEPAAETRRSFHRRKRQPHVITGYFKARHVRYAIEESLLTEQGLPLPQHTYVPPVMGRPSAMLLRPAGRNTLAVR